MPSLLISKNDDGTVTVAPCDPTPEQLADGEQFATIEEATQAVTSVLGAPDDEAAEGTQPPQEEAAEGEMPMKPGQMEGDMAHGFNRARKGY